jgi:hypothetical protein
LNKEKRHSPTPSRWLVPVPMEDFWMFFDSSSLSEVNTEADQSQPTVSDAYLKR